MDFLNLILPYISLGAGLAALVLCGNWLVTGGIELARLFKISTLVVGLTVVAFGTSAPELFVSIGSAIKGAPDIALGNVIGSNIANIVLVLGLTALILPIPILNKAVGFDLTVMLVATVLLFILGYNGVLGRIEGIILVSILIGYTAWSIYKGKRDHIEIKVPEIDENKKHMKPVFAVLLVAVAITGLYFGSQWFINGARDIARQWGVSERIIGISVVAIGTSLPELVASVISAIRKEMDLSVGNIIGSNIFNIAMVLGTTSIIHPLEIANRAMFQTDMIWVFAVAVALLLAMLPLSKGKITRWKGGMFLLAYVVYIYLLYGM